MTNVSPKAFAKRVRSLAYDLRWTYCPNTQQLFEAIDPQGWEASGHAPLTLLARLHPVRLASCAEDPVLIDLLEAAEAEAAAYASSPTWFERSHPRSRLRVAYFCSEFALHESLQQYSGGLGVLAGDHLKSASDLGVPLVAVGFLYRHGYYVQELRRDGSTRVLYPHYDFDELPVVDTGQVIACPLGQRLVQAKVWRQQVGRVSVFLLDADIPGEPRAHRQLTEGLYKGEPDLRLRQQVLLGIGGMLALQAVKRTPTVVHLNEGHAAFANVERLAGLVEQGDDFGDALSKVRASSVFTTHTPVPAGHDRYEPARVARYLRPSLKRLGLTTQSFADLGREQPGDKQEALCMTVLALRTAALVNGVSALHGEVSRRMWMGVYGATSPDDVPIGHVTNGVHARTWLAREAGDLYSRRLLPKWNGMGPRDDPWSRADKISDEELWSLRQTLRAKLVHCVRSRLARQAQRRGENASVVAAAYRAFDPDALTIGFARRFATYKRAPLIFREAERLAALLQDTQRPMQLVFAGKAHPRDEGGQAFARRIHGLARRSPYVGRVALVEEYDMHLGRILTSGCDVWLNNPIRPHEACGTSGMKPPLHGGLNASILDGWWPEGFDGTNGWAIGDGSEDPGLRQDQVDAAAIVDLLEDELLPLFYERDADGLPRAWIARQRESLRTIPGAFHSHRMLGDYVEQAYLPALAGRTDPS